MSASRTLWFKQLKALTERRGSILKGFESFLPWEPWAKDSLERQLTRINDEEVALWGMYDDLEVLVRTSSGAPKLRYHRADMPCGHARFRGFRRMLESQARAQHLTRCPVCCWAVTEDFEVSA